MKTNRRFKKVAIEDGIILEGPRALPQKGAGPMPVPKRAVVQNGSRHALLIFSGKERLWTLDACIGILPAPVLPWLNGQSGRPRIHASLSDGPAVLVRFAPVETGSFNPHDAICQADSEHVVCNVR